MERQLRHAALRLALGILPAPVLQHGLDQATSAVMRQHPAIGSRLQPWAGSGVLIEPTDVRCPLLLQIEAPPRPCRLRVTPDGVESPVARISGPLAQLVDLLEGHADGDALFFSRELSVSGDTAVVVALRNAVDGEAIDLFDDLLALLGPLSGPARGVSHRLAALAAHADGQLERWRSWLVAPALERCDQLAADLDDLRATRDAGRGGRRGR